MMINCWNFEPQDRPTFKELSSTASSLIEKFAGYLDMNFKPFSNAEMAKPFIPEPEKNEDVEVEAEVSIQVFPPSVKKSNSYLVD